MKVYTDIDDPQGMNPAVVGDQLAASATMTCTLEVSSCFLLYWHASPLRIITVILKIHSPQNPTAPAAQPPPSIVKLLRVVFLV